MLAEIRSDVAAQLTAGGVKAVEYVGETITPPCAVVVPGQPYLAWRVRDLVFGHTRVRFDVLLVSHREAAKRAADLIDDLIVKSLVALLPGWDVTEVSQPGIVTLSGSKFMGSVLTIEHDIEEPG